MEIDYDKMIEGMCMTYRHDYGIIKPEPITFLEKMSSGMTTQEREALRTTMRQLIEHNVRPVIDCLQRELTESSKSNEPAPAAPTRSFCSEEE